LKELRDALGNDYGITATLPSSYWYLQYFDIKGMEQYLDWFNVMSQYLHLVKVVQDDTNTCLRSVRYPWYITKTNFLHMRLALTIITGTWDGANKFTKKVVQAHTNLTEIDLGLDLLWRNGIDSKKVVMGLGFYGRAFTLQDPSCKKPGCPFSGGAKKGKCTGESGILSNSEIQDIISENGLTPTLVKEDAIKYMVWNTDQWVSYDDEETLKMKLDYANKLCLGGTMIWALDLDKPGKDTSVDSLIGSEVGRLKESTTQCSFSCSAKQLIRPGPILDRLLADEHPHSMPAGVSCNCLRTWQSLRRRPKSPHR
jgi:chitinase